jgi:hypothetical protein
MTGLLLIDHECGSVKKKKKTLVKKGRGSGCRHRDGMDRPLCEEVRKGVTSAMCLHAHATWGGRRIKGKVDDA